MSLGLLFPSSFKVLKQTSEATSHFVVLFFQADWTRREHKLKHNHGSHRGCVLEGHEQGHENYMHRYSGR